RTQRAIHHRPAVKLHHHRFRRQPRFGTRQHDNRRFLLLGSDDLRVLSYFQRPATLVILYGGKGLHVFGQTRKGERQITTESLLIGGDNRQPLWLAANQVDVV